jgi:hypothetical protein
MAFAHLDKQQCIPISRNADQPRKTRYQVYDQQAAATSCSSTQEPHAEPNGINFTRTVGRDMKKRGPTIQ